MMPITDLDVLYRPYPFLVIDTLKEALEDLPEVEPGAVFTRLLKPLDPNGSVGITMIEWLPGEPLIGGFEPISGEYSFLIQALTKNTNADEGNLRHYLLGDAIKRMLHRNEVLIAALKSLAVDDDSHEHTSRWGISNQRYLNNEIDQQFVFLSGTQLYFTTEIAC